MRYSYILFCSPIIPPSTESMPTSINTIYECVMRYTYNGSWNITLPKIQSKSTNKMRHYMHVCVLYQGWRYNCSIGALTSSFPHDLLQLTFNLYNLTYLTWPLTSFNWVALLLKNNNVHCILLHFCYTMLLCIPTPHITWNNWAPTPSWTSRWTAQSLGKRCGPRVRWAYWPRYPACGWHHTAPARCLGWRRLGSAYCSASLCRPCLVDVKEREGWN